MMNTIEKNRRKKRDVCSCCGWTMVTFEFNEVECGNPRCFHPDNTRKHRSWC